MSDNHQPKRHVLPAAGWPNVLADILAEVHDGGTIVVRNETQHEAVTYAVAGRDINVVRYRFERFQAGEIDNPHEVAKRLFRKLTGKNPDTDQADAMDEA